MPSVAKLLSFLLKGFRHAVVCVAILAALAVAVRFHVHAAHPEPTGHHGCALDQTGECPSDADEPLGDDPEGGTNDCTHCHCPPAVVAFAESTALYPTSVPTCLTHRLHDAQIPDNLNAPPDLPPVSVA
jgi:hypothetical protein